MQFRDLQRQYEALKPAIDHAMVEVASSGTFILGRKVEELESRLAEYVGVRHCVTCGNGTDALYLALRVWGIGPGDAVFVPDFTFFASAEVVSLVGATPVFVDVDEGTFNMSASDLERKIGMVRSTTSLRPKVILAVDLFGLPAEYLVLREIADRNGLLVLEDGAQGFGGCIGDRKACSFGDIGITSFFPAKPLGCYGDGGALFTDNESWADMARSYRAHGRSADKYNNVRVGINSRLDALQAAVLLVKIEVFDNELDAMDAVAAQYTSCFCDRAHCPIVPHGYRSSWAQYTLRFDNAQQRDAFRFAFSKKDVPTQIYYPTPLHLQPVYRDMGEAYCPVATRLSNTVLSLPMHPYLTIEEIERITQ